MTTEKQEQGIVAGGGWIRTGAELKRPRARRAGFWNLVWLVGGSFVVCAWPENSVLAVFGVVQGALLGVAIIFWAMEQPVLVDRLARNPDVKPHGLY